MKTRFHRWRSTVGMALVIVAIGFIAGFVRHSKIEDTVMYRMLIPINLLSVALLITKS